MSRRRLAAITAVALGGLALVIALGARGASGHRAAPRAVARVIPVAGDQLRVLRVIAEPQQVVIGEPVHLVAEVERGTAATGALRYTWSVPGDAVDRPGVADVMWRAPGKPGPKRVSVTVDDGAHKSSAYVMIEVRLPTPREAPNLAEVLKQQKMTRDVDMAQQIGLELQLADLEEVAAKGDTVADLLAAQEALEQMASLLGQLGRYDEALVVWDRLLSNMLPGASKYANYSTKRGDVAFLTGDEDGALAAWEAGGDYTQGMSRYYQGELLERRGDIDGALEAYAAGRDGAPYFGDLVYREASLLLAGGADPDAVADLLVDASVRLDRDQMLARFAGDPDTAALGRLLEDTGRVDDLVARQEIITDAEAPAAGAAPGGG